MIEKILTSLITNFASKIFQWAMDYFNGLKEKKQTYESIDKRLQDLKDAVKDAYDGTPKTPEQKAKLDQAIVNFIRGGGTGKL